MCLLYYDSKNSKSLMVSLHCHLQQYLRQLRRDREHASPVRKEKSTNTIICHEKQASRREPYILCKMGLQPQGQETHATLASRVEVFSCSQYISLAETCREITRFWEVVIKLYFNFPFLWANKGKNYFKVVTALLTENNAVFLSS